MFRKNNKTTILVMILLIVFFTPVFNWLYSLFFGPACSGFYCLPNPELSYVFFVSLFLMFLGNRNKYKYLIILLGLVLFLDAIVNAYEMLIISSVVAAGGGLIGFGMNKIMHKDKKNSLKIK